MLKLELNFCHRCQCNHPFGQHRGTPPARLPPGLAQTPAAVALHSFPNGQTGHTAKAIDRNRENPVPNTPRPKKPPRGAGNGSKPFNKDQYQAEYMSARREADDLGFGGSRNPRHPAYNPNYKTVSQFRVWKAAQGKK